MTGCQPFSDNVSRCRAPAHAPADASRREQRAKEAFTSASPMPPLLTSLNFSTTSGDLPHLSPSSNLHPLIGNVAMTSDMEHTSDAERNNRLSHAEILNNEARCTAVESHLENPVDTSKQQQQQKCASLSEAVKISVTKEREDLISYSVHELSRVQSSPVPLPSLLLSGPPSLSGLALHAQVHQSSSSPHFASPIAQRPLSTSPRTMTKNNKLKKAIHPSLQGELLHKSSYIVASKRGNQILTSDQSDSIEEEISKLDRGTQMTTETDMSGINDKDKNKMSISRSLSRKLSKKFRKDKSPDTTTSKRGTNTSKDVRKYFGSRSSPQMNENPSIGYPNIGDEDQSEIARGRERRSQNQER